jgi:hypothetical protein
MSLNHSAHDPRPRARENATPNPHYFVKNAMERTIESARLRTGFLVIRSNYSIYHINWSRMGTSIATTNS